MRVVKDNIDEIYVRYKDHVFGLGFSYFRNEMDADDIVQETFMKLMKAGKDFESEDHLRNWIIETGLYDPEDEEAPAEDQD